MDVDICSSYFREENERFTKPTVETMQHDVCSSALAIKSYIKGKDENLKILCQYRVLKTIEEDLKSSKRFDILFQYLNAVFSLLLRYLKRKLSLNLGGGRGEISKLFL
jgi:hypothetical protein